MFASRAVSNTPSGHRCTSSAKFTSTRDISHDAEEREFVHEIEDTKHPGRSLACALLSSFFCPLIGLIALFYAIRALQIHNEGFYAEATTFYKKAIRWSLITFIIGLLIHSIILFSIFVRAVLFV